MIDSAAVQRQHWDVIIIGTGVGGATVGRSLAGKGLSVLFLEKGFLIGPGAEGDATGTPESRMANGWWPHPVSQRKPNGDCKRFYAAVGCAVGGSSIHYAAALERMAASDFEGLRTPSGPTLPWPVGFSEFVPLYEAAEKLYRISGEASLIAERRMSEWDRALMDQMRQNGLKPDPLHVAIRYDDQCQECIGRVCPRDCKSDARVACLIDALRQPQCQILERCDVRMLEADDDRVRVVKAIHQGRELELHASI